MKPRNFHRDSKEVGIVWYLLPGVWVVAAVAALLIVDGGPASVGDATPARDSANLNVFSVAPYAGGDPSLPAAGTVFTERLWEVSEHVEQF